MRLTDLKPRWLDFDGRHVAVMFLCPHCAGRGPDTWLTCFFEPAGDLPQAPSDYPIEGLQDSRWSRILFYEALKQMGHHDPVEGAYHDVVGCKSSCAWKRTSDDFATMSVTPSIDSSPAGHWHGFIVAGEIK
jgi:hypothetical protein